MMPIDKYRQSDFATRAAEDRKAVRAGVVLCILAAAVIAIDMWLLLDVLAR